LAFPFFNGSEEEAKRYFDELLALNPIVNQTGMMPYESLNGIFNASATFGDRKSSGASAVKCPLDPKLVQEVFHELNAFVEQHPGTEASMVMLFFIPYQKIRSVP
jgi:hypothetical protein